LPFCCNEPFSFISYSFGFTSKAISGSLVALNRGGDSTYLRKFCVDDMGCATSLKMGGTFTLGHHPFFPESPFSKRGGPGKSAYTHAGQMQVVPKIPITHGEQGGTPKGPQPGTGFFSSFYYLRALLWERGRERGRRREAAEERGAGRRAAI